MEIYNSREQVTGGWPGGGLIDWAACKNNIFYGIHQINEWIKL